MSHGSFRINNVLLTGLQRQPDARYLRRMASCGASHSGGR